MYSRIAFQTIFIRVFFTYYLYFSYENYLLFVFNLYNNINCRVSPQFFIDMSSKMHAQMVYT